MTHHLWIGAVRFVVVATLVHAGTAAQSELSRETLRLESGDTCLPSWVPTFGELPGISGSVHAVAVYDDGGGPALFAAGNFSFAGNTPANRIAKWSGSGWTALGSGLDGDVNALAVYDDGSG